MNAGPKYQALFWQPLTKGQRPVRRYPPLDWHGMAGRKERPTKDNIRIPTENLFNACIGEPGKERYNRRGELEIPPGSAIEARDFLEDAHGGHRIHLEPPKHLGRPHAKQASFHHGLHHRWGETAFLFATYCVLLNNGSDLLHVLKERCGGQRSFHRLPPFMLPLHIGQRNPRHFRVLAYGETPGCGA